MTCGKPKLCGYPTTWGRLILSALFCLLLLFACFQGLSSRFQFYIPKLAVQCLSWNFGLVDKWDRHVTIGKTYAFYSRNMVLYPDGSKIAKIFAAGPFDLVEIGEDENVRVNGKTKAHGLHLAAKLGHERADFAGEAMLEPGEYFGLGNTWNSFDSRYWGTIHESQLIGRLYLLF